MTKKSMLQAITMPTRPVDEALVGDLPPERRYDFQRPLYRCTVCAKEGESASHKYLDDCPYYGD